MASKYHTLLVREESGEWTPQFGDYSKYCVELEMAEYRRDYRKADIRILTTDSDRQADIVAAIAAINADWRAA